MKDNFLRQELRCENFLISSTSWFVLFSVSIVELTSLLFHFFLHSFLTNVSRGSLMAFSAVAFVTLLVNSGYESL